MSQFKSPTCFATAASEALGEVDRPIFEGISFQKGSPRGSYRSNQSGVSSNKILTPIPLFHVHFTHQKFQLLIGFFRCYGSPFAYPRAFLIILFRVAAGSRSSIISFCSVSETDLKYHSVRVTHNGIRRELSMLPAISPYWVPS